MKLLLDTHVFIWMESQPAKLSSKAQTALEDESNSLLLSVASVWEMQIKVQLGKLKFTFPLQQVIAAQQEVNGIEVLPIQLMHTFALDNLPLHHKDPFDRMLLVQAQVENAVLVSQDSLFSQYPVQILW
jgi:PIN domain nuclease of toxin-antitoxin system